MFALYPSRNRDPVAAFQCDFEHLLNLDPHIPDSQEEEQHRQLRKLQPGQHQHDASGQQLPAPTSPKLQEQSATSRQRQQPNVQPGQAQDVVQTGAQGQATAAVVAPAEKQQLTRLPSGKIGAIIPGEGAVVTLQAAPAVQPHSDQQTPGGTDKQTTVAVAAGGDGSPPVQVSIETAGSQDDANCQAGAGPKEVHATVHMAAIVEQLVETTIAQPVKTEHQESQVQAGPEQQQPAAPAATTAVGASAHDQRQQLLAVDAHDTAAAVDVKTQPEVQCSHLEVERPVAAQEATVQQAADQQAPAQQAKEVLPDAIPEQIRLQPSLGITSPAPRPTQQRGTHQLHFSVLPRHTEAKRMAQRGCANAQRQLRLFDQAITALRKSFTNLKEEVKWAASGTSDEGERYKPCRCATLSHYNTEEPEDELLVSVAVFAVHKLKDDCALMVLFIATPHDYQRRGLGALLVARLKQLAHQQGCKAVFSNVIKAQAPQRFWSYCSFVEAKEAEEPDGMSLHAFNKLQQQCSQDWQLGTLVWCCIDLSVDVRPQAAKTRLKWLNPPVPASGPTSAPGSQQVSQAGVISPARSRGQASVDRDGSDVEASPGSPMASRAARGRGRSPPHTGRKRLGAARRRFRSVTPTAHASRGKERPAASEGQDRAGDVKVSESCNHSSSPAARRRRGHQEASQTKRDVRSGTRATKCSSLNRQQDATKLGEGTKERGSGPASSAAQAQQGGQAGIAGRNSGASTNTQAGHIGSQEHARDGTAADDGVFAKHGPITDADTIITISDSAEDDDSVPSSGPQDEAEEPRRSGRSRKQRELGPAYVTDMRGIGREPVLPNWQHPDNRVSSTGVANVGQTDAGVAAAQRPKSASTAAPGPYNHPAVFPVQPQNHPGTAAAHKPAPAVGVQVGRGLAGAAQINRHGPNASLIPSLREMIATVGMHAPPRMKLPNTMSRDHMSGAYSRQQRLLQLQAAGQDASQVLSSIAARSARGISQQPGQQGIRQGQPPTVQLGSQWQRQQQQQRLPPHVNATALKRPASAAALEDHAAGRTQREGATNGNQGMQSGGDGSEGAAAGQVDITRPATGPAAPANTAKLMHILVPLLNSQRAQPRQLQAAGGGSAAATGGGTEMQSDVQGQLQASSGLVGRKRPPEVQVAHKRLVACDVALSPLQALEPAAKRACPAEASNAAAAAPAADSASGGDGQAGPLTNGAAGPTGAAVLLPSATANIQAGPPAAADQRMVSPAKERVRSGPGSKPRPPSRGAGMKPDRAALSLLPTTTSAPMMMAEMLHNKSPTRLHGHNPQHPSTSPTEQRTLGPASITAPSSLVSAQAEVCGASAGAPISCGQQQDRVGQQPSASTAAPPGDPMQAQLVTQQHAGAAELDLLDLELMKALRDDAAAAAGMQQPAGTAQVLSDAGLQPASQQHMMQQELPDGAEQPPATAVPTAQQEQAGELAQSQPASAKQQQKPLPTWRLDWLQMKQQLQLKAAKRGQRRASLGSALSGVQKPALSGPGLLALQASGRLARRASTGSALAKQARIADEDLPTTMEGLQAALMAARHEAASLSGEKQQVMLSNVAMALEVGSLRVKVKSTEEQLEVQQKRNATLEAGLAEHSKQTTTLVEQVIKGVQSKEQDWESDMKKLRARHATEVAKLNKEIQDLKSQQSMQVQEQVRWQLQKVRAIHQQEMSDAVLAQRKQGRAELRQVEIRYGELIHDVQHLHRQLAAREQLLNEQNARLRVLGGQPVDLAGEVAALMGKVPARHAPR